MHDATLRPTDAYRQSPAVLCQRELTLAEYPDAATALRDARFSRPGPDDPVMLLARRGKRFELNLSAGFIWEQLGSARSLDEVADAVVAAFAVDWQTARTDVEQICLRLAEFGLLEGSAHSHSG